MQRIVLDTNVVVSALVGSSYPCDIVYKHIFEERIFLCLSGEVFDEYVTIEQDFFRYQTFVTNAELVLSRLHQIAIKSHQTVRMDLVRDPSDNKFLELATESGADFLIDGDKKHFTMSRPGKTIVVSPQEFIQQCNR